MIPNKSNSANGCTDNTSSNCVVWQGPDLTCVNICEGDTVSDVVARLAEKLCQCCENPASSGVDIATVNQGCLIEGYGQANTIQSLLNNIIDKLCRCCEQSTPPTDPCSCTIPLPACLRKDAQAYLNTSSEPTSIVLHDSNTGKGYAHFLAELICGIQSTISTMQQTIANHETRITYIENNCCNEATHSATNGPQVLATNSNGNTRPVSVVSAVTSIDREIGNIYQTVGTTTQINTAVAQTPALSQRERLSGPGTMAATQGWITTPRNLAQSFQNLWITMNDTRNAVENLNESVAKPTCSDITYDCVGTVLRSATGTVNAISLDFQGTTLPSTFTECNSRGTKVTITDSSLNVLVKYVDVAQLQDNAPLVIASSELGNLDLGSNYSCRIDFCASDGVTTCQEIQTITIENAMGCPTLTIGTITADTIPFTVSSIQLPAGKGYIINIELQTRNGSLLDSRSFTYQGTDITGSFTNLTPSTQYNLRVTQTKTGSTETTECPVQVVSTGAPVCSTVLYTTSSAEWKTNESALQTGANTLQIATYNDGSGGTGGTMTKWQVGFDNTNNPIVVQAATTGVTGWVHAGEFINDELTTEPLAVTGLSGSPVAPATVVRSHTESGWKYIGTVTDPNSQLYYIYATISTHSHNVQQVVFSCNCSGLYLDTPQPVFYAKRNEKTEITIDAVGYTAGSGTFTWNIATQPTHGTLAFKSGSPTSSKAIYEYTQDNTTMASDSFVVNLTNDCGTTVGTRYISILPAENIPLTSTEVIVFFDTTMNIDNAREIKNSMNAVRAGFSGGTKPTFSYVAVDGTVRGDYLKHVKACVENVGTFTSAANPYGAAISMPTSGLWYTDIMNSGATLPASWGSTGALPTSVQIISFVVQVNANGTYGKANIPGTAAWSTPTEPTSNGGSGAAQYKEDFDAIIDITSSAAPTSAWGIATQGQTNFPWKSGSIPFTVSQCVVPLISGTNDATVAVALQSFAALGGASLMTEQEYMGAKLGLERYKDWGPKGAGIDLSKYLLSGATGSLGNTPYSGSTTVSGNTIVGLKDVASTYFLSVHAYLENWIDFKSTTNLDIKTYFRGMFGLTPSGSTGEPTTPGAQRMGAGNTYAFHTTGANDAAKIISACNNAKISGNCKEIYNVSGTEFKDDERAYTTLSGARNEQSEYELTNGLFYARCAGTTGVKVAKYNTTPVGGKFWTDETTCA